MKLYLTWPFHSPVRALSEFDDMTFCLDSDTLLPSNRRDAYDPFFIHPFIELPSMAFTPDAHV
jgi:hypothetical protein